jgi:nucleoid-associated protein YgaU
MVGKAKFGAGAGSKLVVVGVGLVAAAALLVFLRPSPVVQTIAVPKQVAAPTAPPEVAQTSPAVAPAPSPPKFDVVRVERDGSALIAGQASRGAGVSVLVDGAVVSTVIADKSGGFAALFSMPPSDQPRVLTLQMRLADGAQVVSVEQVILSPSDVAAPDGVPVAATAVVTAAPLTAAVPPQVLADLQAIVPSGAAPDSLPATPRIAVVPDAPMPGLPDPLPAQPAALLLGPDGPRPLQPTKLAQDAGGAASVVVDTISYTATGAVTVGGWGAAGSMVQLYLDTQAVGGFTVGADGRCGGVLPNIDPGVYILRADQMDAQARVTARFETPFQREAAAAILAAAPNPEPALTVQPQFPAGDAPPPPPAPITVTVQPGLTLWAIARDQFGDGVLYVKVFEANKDRIRDPDLIYPGQVFALPAP